MHTNPNVQNSKFSNFQRRGRKKTIPRAIINMTEISKKKNNNWQNEKKNNICSFYVTSHHYFLWEKMQNQNNQKLKMEETRTAPSVLKSGNKIIYLKTKNKHFKIHRPLFLFFLSLFRKRKGKGEIFLVSATECHKTFFPLEFRVRPLPVFLWCVFVYFLDQ